MGLFEDWDLTTTLLLQPFPLLLPSASPLHPSESCSSSVFSFHVLHLILSFSPSLHLLNPIVLPIPSSSSLLLFLSYCSVSSIKLLSLLDNLCYYPCQIIV